MLEVTGTVVDYNLSLVGLILKGAANEFGEVGSQKVERVFSLQECKRWLPHCKNFTIKAGKIVATTKKRLNDLDMYEATSLSYHVPVDKGISLTSKIVADGKIIGFDVYSNYNKQTNRYRYQDVVTLCGWFKPTNFIVKFTEDGKAFISGKPGVMRLDDLPTIESLTKSGRAVRRKENAVAKPAVNKREGVVDTHKTDKVMSNTLDIFSILQAINEHNGVVIYENTSDNKYQNTTDTTTKVGEAFIPIGNCLIGHPYPDYSADKMKVNIKFRKPGIVSVDAMTKVYAFTYNDRTVIKNGDNYIKKIVVGVEPEASKGLLSYFARCGGDLHISKWEDEKLKKEIEAFNGNKGLEYYVIDLSKINVLSRKMIEEWSMSEKQMYDTVKGLLLRQCRIKGLKKHIERIKLATPGIDSADDKEVSPMYAAFNEEYLAKLTEAGIDIKTGAYTKRDNIDKSVQKKGTDSEKAPITIGWDVKGYSFGSITADDIIDGSDKALKNKCYVEMIQKFGEINKLSFEEAKSELDELNNYCKGIKRILWINNTVMLQKTGYTKVLKGEGENWVEVPSRSKTGARKFESTKVPGLLITVNGVELG